MRGGKCLLLGGRQKSDAGEEEATAREEAASLGRRSCSAIGPLEGEKAGLCAPPAFL